MEGLKKYLLDEINNTPNLVHQKQLREYLEEIEIFISSAFSEVEEILLEDGIVVPMEEYVRVVNLLNEALTKKED
tara:strand:- start:993 stop:1217 length:225 start_codon:yes stop_codon:yes gene_type:complete